MKQSTTALAFLISSLCSASAQRIPFQRKYVKSPPSKAAFRTNIKAAADTVCSNAQCGALNNLEDAVYFSDITVGGENFVVQLDTGSSDLWVNASVQPVNSATVLQSVVVSNVYGDGSNFTGPVAFADVQFHGFEVKNQTFTYATTAENDNTSGLNLTGLIGLSFNSLSNNEQAVTQALNNATLGQTFLSNVFAQNATQPRFISFLLSRGQDLNHTDNADGAFTISQFEQGFEAVDQQKELDVITPPSGGGSQTPAQWTVALDSLSVGGSKLSSSSNQIIALLDTGTSAALAPESAVDAIYGSIAGSVKTGDATNGFMYLIPCDVEPPATVFTFGGQAVPVHPLDLSTVFVEAIIGGSPFTICNGAISSTGSNLQGQGFDFLLGDTFLRNAYTTFHFSNSTDPKSSDSDGAFIKLLALTDPASASSDYNTTRKAQLSSAPAASAAQISQLAGANQFTTTGIPLIQTSGSSAGVPNPTQASPTGAATPVKFMTSGGLIGVFVSVAAAIFGGVVF